VCSQHNPDAAPADERNELLQSGPWCFGNMDGDIVLECDGRAQRSQRAGIYELQVRLPAFLNTTVPLLNNPSSLVLFVLAEMASTGPTLL
tara:strand:- start:3746 stop:4015 length:270 start_codon:yes stop_codon:yes gene_type:complete